MYSQCRVVKKIYIYKHSFHKSTPFECRSVILTIERKLSIPFLTLLLFFSLIKLAKLILMKRNNQPVSLLIELSFCRAAGVKSGRWLLHDKHHLRVEYMKLQPL